MNKPNLKDISNSLREKANLIQTSRQSFNLKSALKKEASARAEFDQQVCATLAHARKGLNHPDHQLSASRLTDIKLSWKQSLINLKSELEVLENV